jgi:hypothetical protein
VKILLGGTVYKVDSPGDYTLCQELWDAANCDDRAAFLRGLGWTNEKSIMSVVIRDWHNLSDWDRPVIFDGLCR